MGNVVRFRRLKHGAPQLRPRRATDWLGTLAIVGLGFFASAAGVSLLSDGGLAARVEPASIAGDPEQAQFTHCIRGQGTNCVIDGDTLRYRGAIVRIADIDTPEVRNYDCASEKTRGDAATRRLLALMNAGPFALQRIDRDEDQYGRKLRIVTRDGASLGMMLVSEGHARQWDGARRGWC